MILRSDLPNNFIRWLASYLHGRLDACLYNDSLSLFRHIHTGVSQSSVIASCLINHYVSDFPHSSPLLPFYADDFTAAASSSDYRAASAILTNHAFDEAEWVSDKHISVHLAHKITLHPFYL